jgi:hypothetical protein
LKYRDVDSRGMMNMITVYNYDIGIILWLSVVGGDVAAEERSLEGAPPPSAPAPLPHAPHRASTSVNAVPTHDRYYDADGVSC